MKVLVLITLTVTLDFISPNELPCALQLPNYEALGSFCLLSLMKLSLKLLNYNQAKLNYLPSVLQSRSPSSLSIRHSHRPAPSTVPLKGNQKRLIYYWMHFSSLPCHFKTSWLEIPGLQWMWSVPNYDSGKLRWSFPMTEHLGKSLSQLLPPTCHLLSSRCNERQYQDKRDRHKETESVIAMPALALNYGARKLLETNYSISSM